MRIFMKLSLVPILCMAETAHAYIGPGLGAGAIGTLLGVVGAILLAVVGLFYYPLKRLFKKIKSRKEKSTEKEFSVDSENGDDKEESSQV